MTREEKVDIMQEAILAEIGKLQKKVDGLHHGKVQNDTGSSSEELGELRELIVKLGSVKIPVYKPELSNVNDKLDRILNLLNSKNNGPENRKVNKQKSGSATALKKTSILFNSKWLNWILIILLLGSLAFNFFIFHDYSLFRQSHLKYEFLYYSGNEEYLSELDSLWQIDSLRKQRISFIDQRKKEIEVRGCSDLNLEVGSDNINSNKPEIK